jgi:hypothetical protein
MQNIQASLFDAVNLQYIALLQAWHVQTSATQEYQVPAGQTASSGGRWGWCGSSNAC